VTAPFEYRTEPGDDNDFRALKVLHLIVSEFISDPMSVQCFDRRTVEEAKAVIAERIQLERSGRVPPLLTEATR
jgi:hypothetical protein